MSYDGGRVQCHLSGRWFKRVGGSHSLHGDGPDSILRFDEQMLVTLHLWGVPAAEAPLLHIRRAIDDGLFEQYSHHFDAVWADASEAAEPNPALYPPPDQNPDRYAAVTQDRYEVESGAPMRS